MSLTTSLRLTLLAASAIAGFATSPVHAQAPVPAPGPAYYVSEFELTDAEGIRPYSARVESTFAPFGGKYIARGGQVVSLEGEPAKRVVMVAFPSMAQARAWYDSPVYRDLRPIRQRSATSRVFVVDSGAAASPPTVPAAAPGAMTITPQGSQASVQGAEQLFTGSVRIDPLFPVNPPSRVSGGSVTFEPGARSAWHTHPLGQILVVNSGTGWVEEWNGIKRQIKPGDVIWTPPGVKHWNGATATNGLTHLAIQESLAGKNVESLEKVSDEQYRP